MKVSKPYVNLAKAIIDTFWTRAIEKQGRPALSKAQIRAQIVFTVAQLIVEDGDRADWTFCDHCEGEGLYSDIGPDKKQIGIVGQPDQILVEHGLCYQCRGKGWQSVADRKRNAGYQRRRDEREAAF